MKNQKLNKMQKLDAEVRNTVKQWSDFLIKTKLDLLPVEWEEEKQTKFLKHLYELVDKAYYERNDKVNEIWKKCDFLSFRRIIPMFFICLLSLIGFCLSTLKLNPEFYTGIFFSIYVIATIFATYFHNQYVYNTTKASNIIKKWCLSGAGDKIRDRMKKMVEEMREEEKCSE